MTEEEYRVKELEIISSMDPKRDDVDYEDICCDAAYNTIWDNKIVDEEGRVTHYDIFDKESLRTFEASIESLLSGE